jgi:hypothetical protein
MRRLLRKDKLTGFKASACSGTATFCEKAPHPLPDKFLTALSSSVRKLYLI